MACNSYDEQNDDKNNDVTQIVVLKTRQITHEKYRIKYSQVPDDKSSSAQITPKQFSNLKTIL